MDRKIFAGLIFLLVVLPSVSAVELSSPSNGSSHQGVVNFTFSSESSPSVLYFNKTVDYPFFSDGFTNYDDYKYGTGTDNVVLTGGAAGSPDSWQAFSPYVTYNDGEYRMYYACKSTGGVYAMCLANSTTPDHFTYNKVIISLKPSSWYQTTLANPFIIDNCTGNGQTCMYTQGNNGSAINLGLFLSDDNDTWTEWAGNNCYASAGNGCIISPDSFTGVYSVGMGSIIWNPHGDGLEALFFAAVDPDFQNNNYWRIVYANTTDGVNWNKDISPIMKPEPYTKWDIGIAPSKCLQYVDEKYVGLFVGKDAAEAGLSSDGFYFEATTLYDNSTWTIQSNEYISNTRTWESQEVENYATLIVDDTIYFYYDAWTSNPTRIGFINISLNTFMPKANTTNQYVTYDFSGYPEGSTVVWNIYSGSEFAPLDYVFTIGAESSVPITANVSSPIVFLLCLTLLMVTTGFAVNEMMKEDVSAENVLKMGLFLVVMLFITVSAYQGLVS